MPQIILQRLILYVTFDSISNDNLRKIHVSGLSGSKDIKIFNCPNGFPKR